jgi:predicted DNA-binding transcriptional regulator AlpA
LEVDPITFKQTVMHFACGFTLVSQHEDATAMNHHNINTSEERKLVVRITEAARMLGVSKSTVWARANSLSSRYDPAFPRIFHLHSNPSGKGAVGMFLDDLEQYLRAQWDQSSPVKPTNHR